MTKSRVCSAPVASLLPLPGNDFTVTSVEKLAATVAVTTVIMTPLPGVIAAIPLLAGVDE